MRHQTQEEAQQSLDRFRRLWREAIAKAQEKPPAYWDAVRARHRVDYVAELVAAKDRECGAPVDARARLRDAGVEVQHLDGLRNLDERPAFQATRRWWSQPRMESGELETVDEHTGLLKRVPRLVRRWPFLVLLGPSGVGKTQATAWALREAVRAYPWNTLPGGSNVQRRPFLLLKGPDFASLPLYGNHDHNRVDAAEDVLLEARRAVVLVLDELFREPLSKPHRAALAALLIARHGDNRATILTANMDQLALEQSLDGATSGEMGPLWRRISEAGVVVTLKRKGLPELLVGGTRKDWARSTESRAAP